MALFPDHFEDSNLGEILAGRKVGKLGDVSDNPRRGINSEEIDPDTPYIGLQHIPQRSISLSDWGNAEEVTSNKYAFDNDDFLFGKFRPYFRKVGVAPVDGVCSTDILVITPKSGMWAGYALVLFQVNHSLNMQQLFQLGPGCRVPS